MDKQMQNELRKITAVITLKHLVSLETLERWAREARRQAKQKQRRLRLANKAVK